MTESWYFTCSTVSGLCRTYIVMVRETEQSTSVRVCQLTEDIISEDETQ